MKPATLRVRLFPRAETAVRSGHPWVFDESIREQNRPGTTGELAIIYDKKDAFLAIGLFDGDSPIRIRVLHRGKPLKIDSAWWNAKFAEAIHKRAEVFDGETTGGRWIHGENDGFPGLVLDRYDQSCVLKLYSRAWLPRLEEITDEIRKHFRPLRLVLRLSRNIQSSGSPPDGTILFGEPLTAPVIFSETGLQFEADVLRGQKTGFFLDQRENRRHVERLARGLRVLNCFSFSGGFSLYAARGGATRVTDVDISAHALASAASNFSLNAHADGVRTCSREPIQANVFDWLIETKRRFDLVILDPPSLAKREHEREQALEAYAALVTSGFEKLESKGILVAASCSAHVSREEFLAKVRGVASRYHAEEFLSTTHPPDHPATFPEAHYLKTIYFRK